MSSLADCTTASLATLIWFVVSVPVLSEQMTVVQPRVSTEGRLHAPDGDPQYKRSYASAETHLLISFSSTPSAPR